MSNCLNMAVDSGYGYSLGKSEIKNVIIPNFIKKITEDDAKRYAETIKQVSQDNIILKYQNSYYAVGNLALKADPRIKRNPTNDRVHNINHLIEILSTMGLLCENRNFEVNLVVGVPNKLQSIKKDMVKWLKNNWEFSYLTCNGEVFKSIDVKNVACIEQPIAAIYNLSQKDLDSSNIISCDIGHNTADGVYLTSGSVSLNSDDWMNARGVIWCYKELEKRLVANFRDKYQLFEVLERDLQQAIEFGIFKIHNQKVDIQNILNNIYEDYADYIAGEIIESYEPYLSTTDYLICSGGIISNHYFTQLLADRFKKYDITFAIFKNPQASIVEGMFILANTLFPDNIAGEEVADEEQPER